jgi:hypothetical protein
MHGILITAFEPLKQFRRVHNLSFTSGAFTSSPEEGRLDVFLTVRRIVAGRR